MESGQGSCKRDPVETLLSISKSFRALYGMKLASTGLFNGQDELLMVLDEVGKTTSRVAAELSIRPSTVSKMADRLIEGGIVERAFDNADRRLTMLKITPSGKVLRQSVVAARGEMSAELLRWSDQTGANFGDLEAFASFLSTRLKRFR